MANCPNCKRKITCGCQKRTAPDGTQACTGCINTFTKNINNKTTNKKIYK